MNPGSGHPFPFQVPVPGGPVLEGEEEGDGRRLVLLHGVTATRRYVLQGSRLLARSGYRVVGYDARGHGESGAADSYDYPSLVGDLDVVLAERGIERCVLAGSSMGAHTAIAFALEHPDRVAALVLITPAYSGAPYDDPEVLAGWDARADALEAGDIDRFVALAGGDTVPERFRDTVRTALRQRIERHRDLAAVAAATRAVPRSAAFDGLERLESLDLPALVVASRDELDPEHPLMLGRRYAELLPRGELVTEDEGESPLAWRGSQLSKAIGAFLERHW